MASLMLDSRRISGCAARELGREVWKGQVQLRCGIALVSRGSLAQFTTHELMSVLRNLGA